MQDEQRNMFLEIYELYNDAIFRHCFFRVNCNRERAEDLTQETFIKTWDYLRKGKEIDNMQAFLYRVANNCIIDSMRKKTPVSLDALMEKGFDAPNTTGMTTEDTIEISRIRDILENIEEPYRTAVALRYIDDISPKNIALMLNESEDTVSVRIHRGVQKIKKFYEQS